MTYACPALGTCCRHSVNETVKPENKCLHTNGNFTRHTQGHNLYMSLRLQYEYAYIIKFCSKQVEVIENHKNANFHNIGQGKA
jgi:hypothetical protein